MCVNVNGEGKWRELIEMAHLQHTDYRDGGVVAPAL